MTSPVTTTPTTKPTNNTKWILGLIAAFALGASASALMMGMPGQKYTPQQIAAAAVEPSAGTSAPDTTPVIANVNGQKLTMKDYQDYLRTMPEQVAHAPQEQVFPMVQDQMIVGHLISAQASDLENDPEVTARVATLKKNVIRAAWLERAVNAKVTDAGLKKEYDTFVKDFVPAEEVSAQHILVDDEAKAKEIITKLSGGAKFEDLVKEFSKDKQSGDAGALGFFKKTDMVKEFADAAFALKKGETSQTPVKTQFGYHVIRLTDRRLSQAPSFEEMLPQIKSKLQREAFDTIIGDLRKNAKIELFDAQGQPVQAAQSNKEPATAEPAAGEKTDQPKDQ